MPWQMFNMDETSLFWKRMPGRAFTHNETKSVLDFKAFKNRISLAWGQCCRLQMENLVIWHRENPRVFQHSIKPVYYRSNKKSWVTQLLFQDALLNGYASEMEKYCLVNNIPFNILLIVDNASGNPLFIGDL